MEELKGGNPYQESAPSYLRRWAGITPFANDGTGNPTRGIWTMQGIMYAVIGPTLYSVDRSGNLTNLGTGIPGTSFVRMTDNTSCLVVLEPNSTNCWTYCPNAKPPVVLTGVVIADTTGDFICNATTLAVGDRVTITGTFSGAGAIENYADPTPYVIAATDGISQFTLTTLIGEGLTTNPGDTSGTVFTDGQNKFMQLTDANFIALGAIDVHFLDSYIVFLSQSGREFYNDDGQIISGQYQITFTTNGTFPREFGTDLFVGMGADHRMLSFFGLWSSEGYQNVGSPIGTPFASAPQTFTEQGMHPDAAYSAALQDDALFWVANDKTVRRKNGQTPVRVSNSGIEAILEHADLTGSYALVPSIAGHNLWVYVMPADFRTIVYDCLTQEWFEIESYKLGYWRALCYNNVYGKQMVGDASGQGIGYLDTSVFTEFTTGTLVASFTTQPIYKDHHRIAHRRLEAVISTGQGGTAGALLSLLVSDNAGESFRGFPMRNLGSTGSFFVRATWFNLGQTRNRVYKFQISDPTPTFTVQLTADVELGKW
jgi:hypothetical protein